MSACRAALLATTVLVGALSPLAVSADDAADIRALRQQIESLRAEQARRIAEIQQQSDSQIRGLEVALDRLAGEKGVAVVREPAPVPPAAAPSRTDASRFTFGGDLRLRYEDNFGDSANRNRNRGVLRARLRTSYQVLDWLTVGGQITTGDPDDPNSTDIDLSNFDDDLQVSLDQAYLRATFGSLTLTGGKMAQPFTRTELVWDNDVSPQGLAASYKLKVSDRAALKFTGMYFLIDESVAGSDSDMTGAQAGFEFTPSSLWQTEAAVAYYDYKLRSIGGADAGDFRTNLLGPGSRYLSDFNLIDVVGSASYLGFGVLWPVKLTGNYVRNMGAFTAADTGYSVDLGVGRSDKAGGWRFAYGYASADADAVFAAFSQDNIAFGSNYLQHSLVAEYSPANHVVLSANLYHYRQKNIAAGLSPDWLNRVRLNVLVNF
ncbi:MAG: putative porin [Rhodospirillaceae bacterium]|nr:putative porin [Rhodospirillaceae bacterium]